MWQFGKGLGYSIIRAKNPIVLASSIFPEISKCLPGGLGIANRPPPEALIPRKQSRSIRRGRGREEGRLSRLLNVTSGDAAASWGRSGIGQRDPAPREREERGGVLHGEEAHDRGE